MPTYTPKFGVKKPLGNETVNLQTSFNDNWDIIDQKGVVNTTADLTYYVDNALGNDANTGLAAGAGNALKTIQAAVNKLPQAINHTVVINVAVGTYAEDVVIEGFIGKGAISVIGGNSLATAVNYLINSVLLRRNSCFVSINGFKANVNNITYDFYALGNMGVAFNYCISSVTTPNGFYSQYSNTYIYQCQASNHTQAGVLVQNGTCRVFDCIGSGNYYGVYAHTGGVVTVGGASGLGKRIRGTYGNEHIQQGGIIGPFATEAATSLYVRTDGSDDNDGSANTAGDALRTIQEAINRLPPRIDHDVTINVAAGTYAETVTISRFTGSGAINILGGTDLATAANFLVNRFAVDGNSNKVIFIRGFKANSDGNPEFLLNSNLHVSMSYCVSLQANSYGALCYQGFYYFSNCQFSNHVMAVFAQNAVVSLVDCTGSGNQYGAYASNGGYITVSGNGAFGKQIRGIYANSIGVNGGFAGKYSTSADINLYVRTDGNDDNDGSANTAGAALRTIQEAINRLPPRIDHIVNINVAAGTYAENVIISGFVGKGSINLMGGTDLATAVNYVMLSLAVSGCSALINATGFTVTNVYSTAGMYIANNHHVVLMFMRSVLSVGSYGILLARSNAKVNGCEISNKTVGGAAMAANETSTVWSINNTGSGSNYGIMAYSGATIGKEGTQFGGTTAEYVSGGGVIR